MSKAQRQRKRPGPKPKPKGEKQSRCVMVRLTNAERAALKRDAAKAGQSLGGHLRELWLAKRKGA